MRSWLAGAVVLGLLAVGLGAQLSDGEIVITFQDVNNPPVVGHSTVVLNPATGKVTTLLTTAQTGSWGGNWVQMAPNNQDVWVAYGISAGAMFVLDKNGAVKSSMTLPWRTDCFRFTNDGGITWSGIGGVSTDRLIKTDMSFNVVATLTGPATLPSTSLNHIQIENGLYACSIQNVSTLGGVAIVDPATQTIVATYRGMGLANTIDFHKGNGKLYVTEFGVPGNTSAAQGTLWEVDPNTGAMSSLIDGRTAGGMFVDRLNWIEYQVDHTLYLGSRHKIFQYDPSLPPGTGAIIATWVFEKDRTRAVTGATVYGNRPLSLDASGGNTSGNTIFCRISTTNPTFASASYFLACSLGYRPGVSLPNGQWVDLDATNPLFIISLLGLAPNIFANFQGQLTNGMSPDPQQNPNQAPRIVIPTVGTSVRLTLYVSGVLIKGASMRALNAVPQVIQLK